jgi:hypothetical protein
MESPAVERCLACEAERGGHGRPSYLLHHSFGRDELPLVRELAQTK